VRPFQLNWPYIIVIGAYHVLALLAFLPGYFSWSGLILAIAGHASVRTVRHQPLLPPASDSSRPEMSRNGWSTRWS